MLTLRQLGSQRRRLLRRRQPRSRTGGAISMPKSLWAGYPTFIAFGLDSILQKIMDYEAAPQRDWVSGLSLAQNLSDASTPGYNLFEASKRDTPRPQGLWLDRSTRKATAQPASRLHPLLLRQCYVAWNQHADSTSGGLTAMRPSPLTSQLRADLATGQRSPVIRPPVLMPECHSRELHNLAYALLKRGAIATNAATRVSWYYPGNRVP